MGNIKPSNTDNYRNPELEKIMDFVDAIPPNMWGLSIGDLYSSIDIAYNSIERRPVDVLWGKLKENPDEPVKVNLQEVEVEFLMRFLAPIERNFKGHDEEMDLKPGELNEGDFGTIHSILEKIRNSGLLDSYGI